MTYCPNAHWCQLKHKGYQAKAFHPHPLAPSPNEGEGEPDSCSPLPFWERGWG